MTPRSLVTSAGGSSSLASSGISIVMTPDEMDRLLPEWQALWEADTGATPFQSPEWLVPWWRHLGEGELRIVTVRKGTEGPGSGRLIGLFPFYLWSEPETLQRKLLPIGIGTSDYLDGVFAPGVAEVSVVRAFEALKQFHDWNVALIPQLRSDSPLLTAPLDPMLEAVTTEAEACEVLSLLEGKDNPLKLVSRGLGQNLRYYQRRAEKAGRVIFEAIAADNALEMFDALVELHQARWNGRCEAGVLANPQVRAAHRESLPQLLARGLLRAYGLRFNGRIIAVLYGLGDGRRVYYYISGFDPAFERFSPGTLLIGHAVQAAAREGAREFDFLRGGERYKGLWNTRSRPTYCRHISRATEG